MFGHSVGADEAPAEPPVGGRLDLVQIRNTRVALEARRKARAVYMIEK
jgi:hypothetical protein